MFICPGCTMYKGRGQKAIRGRINGRGLKVRLKRSILLYYLLSLPPSATKHIPQIDLINTRPVLIKAALYDWISCSKFVFILVKSDIYRTMRQSLYYRIQSESSSLNSTEHGGGPRLAQARKGMVKTACKHRLSDLVVIISFIPQQYVFLNPTRPCDAFQLRNNFSYRLNRHIIDLNKNPYMTREVKCT